jgi:hypothetical protein
MVVYRAISHVRLLRKHELSPSIIIIIIIIIITLLFYYFTSYFFLVLFLIGLWAVKFAHK